MSSSGPLLSWSTSATQHQADGPTTFWLRGELEQPPEEAPSATARILVLPRQKAGGGSQAHAADSKAPPPNHQWRVYGTYSSLRHKSHRAASLKMLHVSHKNGGLRSLILLLSIGGMHA